MQLGIVFQKHVLVVDIGSLRRRWRWRSGTNSATVPRLLVRRGEPADVAKNVAWATSLGMRSARHCIELEAR